MTDWRNWLFEACFIDGQWVPADSGKTVTVTDPATLETLGHVPDAARPETSRAVDAAARAFSSWSQKTAAERAEKLLAMASVIDENIDELATLLTREQGKPLNEARGEVTLAGRYLRWFAEEARRICGDVIPSPWQDRRTLVVKEPVGVVAAITPWNFPTLLIARKVGAALATGCTIVVKPALQTPFSGLAWGKIAMAAQLPAGVLNIVTGDGPVIGDELIDNPAVAKLTFTGSTGVGRQLAGRCGSSLKRITMELGGNAPFVVFDDADLDRAIAEAVKAKFRNSGQTCICTNRFLVQDSVYEAFVDGLTRAASELRVGNGLDPEIEQGPLIEERAVAKVEAHLADALSKGARCVTGGKRHALGGTFFEPTVLADATTQMRLATEETFGPLAAVFRFHTEEEAIAMANASVFGLAGYAFTRDLARAFRVSAAMECGMVGINEGLITTETAPFGGTKHSGFGREGSHYGCDDYLNIKYISLGGL